MRKIANLDSIKKVLDDKSGYEISKLTGVSEPGVLKWKKGDDDQLLKMSFRNAIKLTEIYGQPAADHFEEVKQMFFDSIPGLIAADPDVAARNIINQVEFLLQALEAKLDNEK